MIACVAWYLTITQKVVYCYYYYHDYNCVKSCKEKTFAASAESKRLLPVQSGRGPRGRVVCLPHSTPVSGSFPGTLPDLASCQLTTLWVKDRRSRAACAWSRLPCHCWDGRPYGRRWWTPRNLALTPFFDTNAPSALQHPATWIDGFNYTGPVGHVRALADAFHFLLLCALMLAEITQQKISPGGISESRPPTSLAQQALTELGPASPPFLELWFTALGTHENLIRPVWGWNSDISHCLQDGFASLWLCAQPSQSGPTCSTLFYFIFYFHPSHTSSYSTHRSHSHHWQECVLTRYYTLHVALVGVISPPTLPPRKPLRLGKYFTPLAQMKNRAWDTSLSQ